MKILLCNPPWSVDGRQGVRAGSRWPHLKIPEEEGYMPYPFFLGYASSLLKKNMFHAKAIDAIAERSNYELFYKKVRDFSPDLLFMEVSTPSLKNDLEIIKHIKSFSKCKIAIAGPDMDIFDERFMEENPHIDYALIGEYEFTLLELAQRQKEKNSLKDCLGLVFWENSRIVKNNRRPLEKDLAKYPWPDREDLPVYHYHDCPGSIPSPSVQMIGSRGCPYLCTFCAWPQLVYGGRNYRPRDAREIVDEMEFLVTKKGFKSVYFDDDTFNIGKKRMLEIAYEIKKRRLFVPWAFMGRSDLVDEEILTNLKSAGLAAVKYGVESGVQEIVNNAEKSLNLKVATRNMLLTKRLGIKMHLTFTLGLPGETKETIKRTVDYAIFLDPESVQFSIMTPFPGTRFYDDLKKKGMIVTDDLASYDGNTRSVIKTDALGPDDLLEGQRYAYMRWHQHKKEKDRYRKKSPAALFAECLKEHGPIYTARHALDYIKRKKYRLYRKKA